MKSLRDYFYEVFYMYEGLRLSNGSFEEFRQALDKIFERKTETGFKVGDTVYIEAVAIVTGIEDSVISHDGYMYRVSVLDENKRYILNAFTTSQFLCPTDLPKSVDEKDAKEC